MGLITYTDKETINENTDIPAINKCRAADMNEIKSVYNADAIVDAVYGNSGYIKYNNGFMVQWLEKQLTNVNFEVWSAPIYYANITSTTLGNWTVPFTEVWQQHVTTDQVFYWATSAAPTLTAPGLVRFLRINSQTGASIKAKIFAFGKWK